MRSLLQNQDMDQDRDMDQNKIMDQNTANVWAMFYATITGFSYHPGYKGYPPKLDVLAAHADEMIKEYRKRFTVTHHERRQ